MRILRPLCLFLLSFSLYPALAAAQNSDQSALSKVYPSSAPHLVVMDFESGEVLFEKNARAAMEPASMTKIMTASLVFDRIKSGALSLDETMRVSEDAWTRGGTKSGSSTMFLAPNSEVSVRDLLYGVIVQSGNDACITLAQGIAGSEAAFADLMNQKARDIGLGSANFKNATGWPDPEHVISAYDLAKLASYTIKNYPELYEIYAEKSYRWNGISQPNRNPLISSGFEGADGLKTGHTKSAKYGLVGSAVRDGKRRIIVLNGVETNSERRKESIRVMRSAFGEFKAYSLFKSGDTVSRAPVYMGKQDTVGLIVNDEVFAGMHKSQRSAMSVKVQFDGPVPAPIAAGDQIASLHVMTPGKDPKIIPLFAAEDVALKSAFGRVWAAIAGKVKAASEITQ